jgi:hypothetical protein
VQAAHTDLGQYEIAVGFPTAVWREGLAAAVLIRDETGGRARVPHPDRDPPPEPVARDPADLAAEYATDDRIEPTADTLTAEGNHRPLTPSARDSSRTSPASGTPTSVAPLGTSPRRRRSSRPSPHASRGL